jgi:hypothetical protein
MFSSTNNVIKTGKTAQQLTLDGRDISIDSKTSNEMQIISIINRLK